MGEKMNSNKLNQEVMRILIDKTSEKEHIRELILKLIWEEQKQSGTWHYKTKYKEVIGDYIEKGEI